MSASPKQPTSVRSVEVMREQRAAIPHRPPPPFPRQDVENLLAPLVDGDLLADYIDDIKNRFDVYHMLTAAAHEMQMPSRAECRRALQALGTAIDKLDRALRNARLISDLDGFARLHIAVAAARPWREGELAKLASEQMRKGPDKLEVRDWLIDSLAIEFEQMTGLQANANYMPKKGETPGYYYGPFYELMWHLLQNSADLGLGKAINNRRKARQAPCPQCGSQRCVPIVYGLPENEQLAVRAERGDLVLGGCVIREDRPEWLCKACGSVWGRGGFRPLAKGAV